jgi:hypothetical protein
MIAFDRLLSARETTLWSRLSLKLGFAWVGLAFSTIMVSAGGPVIIYPPNPPPLGAPLPIRDATAMKSGIPPELTSFMGDPFYAPLSARLVAAGAEGKLDDALRARVDAYRATKIALQAELRAMIDLLRETDAGARLVGLEQFAREQTPRVAALEERAEELRRDLAAGSGGFSGGAPRGSEATVLRAAAFFQEGLSPDQRRLLRDAALEKETATGGTQGGPWFLFSPAGARIPPFSGLAPELAAKVKSYQEGKNALKRELCGAVMKSASASTLAELAGQQAPRFAALESVAEEIRRGLVVRNDPTRRPDLPPLPAALDARIVAYRREKLDLQKALLVRVEGVTTKGAVSSGHPGDRPGGGEGSVAQQQEKVREAIAAYTRENAARYTALDKERDAIRAELARLANANAKGTPASAASADALLKKFSDSMQQIEFWRNYRDYQIAVLQPGLSPEQRRLLFDAALEKIALATQEASAAP